MPYTVNATGIVKLFGDHLALNHVDLVIETGSVMALLGPNGAGKTTMVRILATLVRPDAGTATVAGYDVLADPNGVKRSISLTGQFAAVDDMLTGPENLEMMARLRRLSHQSARARTVELLAAFDLADAGDRRVSTYSGGMRRRLDLAMGMIERPRLLFLDEPTTGFDPRSREQLWDTVRRLAEEGVTILLTTQYLEEADQLADTIAVLDHGRIVARGSADELKSSAGSEILRLRFADGITFERAVRCLDRPPYTRDCHRRNGGGRQRRPGPVGRRRGIGPARLDSPPQPGGCLLFAHRRQQHRCTPLEGGRMTSTVSFISDSRTMAARCVRRSLRNPEAFFTALTLPIILMLLFVYVFGGDLRTDGRYVNYVVPGLIVLCAGFGAGTTAVAVATDMTNGIVDRIRSMPVFGSSLLVGHVIASLARNLVATALVIGVGLGIGWRPSGSPLRWAGTVGMIVLFVLALSWLAAAVGLLAKNAEAATSFTMVLMFLPYVSTAFVPAHTMPTALRGFAGYQPFTPIIETMRGLWMGRTSTGASVGHEAWLAIAYCVGILLVSSTAASWLFTHRRTA
jgi:ABC-2 type transport system permease protein